MCIYIYLEPRHFKPKLYCPADVADVAGCFTQNTVEAELIFCAQDRAQKEQHSLSTQVQHLKITQQCMQTNKRSRPKVSQAETIVPYDRLLIFLPHLVLKLSSLNKPSCDSQVNFLLSLVVYFNSIANFVSSSDNGPMTHNNRTVLFQ